MHTLHLLGEGVMLRVQLLSKCLLRQVVHKTCRVGLTRSLSQESQPTRTLLHDFHVSHGGKMVPFAGWSMPLLYDDLSIINSTLHTRKHSSLFDVSHMLQLEVCGEDAEEFLETVLVADLRALPLNSGTLSLLTNSRGGIIDDCIVTRTGETSFYIVSNAGCADKDKQHIKEQLRKFKVGQSKVDVATLDDRSLLALQGPEMSLILSQGIGGDLSELFFMTSAEMEVFGVPNCRVSRCGYTGEDGVEISVPSQLVVELAEKLVAHASVKLAGLGARDTLRLEAGLCLYGNDISDDTLPVEAGLAWCISKRRRNEGGFLGSDIILQQLKDKPARRRVGLVSQGPPARSGAEVVDKEGQVVGSVTSGCPSPTLGHNIAMAYVPRKVSKTGTQLELRIRKKIVPVKVVKMPFTPANYYTA